MNPEMERWASGITLEWALFSVAMAALILIVVAWRLWKDFRRPKEDAREEEG